MTDMTDMNCPEARALIEKLADGEATEAESRQARSHLAACAACRSELELLTATARSLSSPLPEPPEGYFEALPGRVLARLDAKAPVASGSVFRKLLAPELLRWEALAAVVLLAAAVGLVAQREGRLERPAASPSEAVARSTEAPPAAMDETYLEDDVVGQEEKEAEPERRSPAPATAQAPAEEPPVARDRRERAPLERAPGAAPVEEQALEQATADAPRRQAPIDAPESRLADRPDASARRLAEESIAPAAAAFSAAAPGREEDCERWRRYLEETVPEGESARDARYRLARCSISKFDREATDALRATAVADAEAFLEIEEGGARADEIREALERLR